MDEEPDHRSQFLRWLASRADEGYHSDSTRRRHQEEIRSEVLKDAKGAHREG